MTHVYDQGYRINFCSTMNVARVVLLVLLVFVCSTVASAGEDNVSEAGHAVALSKDDKAKGKKTLTVDSRDDQLPKRFLQILEHPELPEELKKTTNYKQKQITKIKPIQVVKEKVEKKSFERRINQSRQAENSKEKLHVPRHPRYGDFATCKLDDFEIFKNVNLGHGSFGNVYAATQIHTGRKVVVKVISHQVYLKNPQFVSREETIQHKLSHSNIAQHYCTMVGEDGSIYMVMELVKGSNLATIAKRGARLDESAVGKIIGQVMMALFYMHDRCIAHRDIKPDNIMLTPRGRIKIIDFGLAKEDCDDKSTSFVGTFSFSSPEALVANREMPYGRATDLYSVGLTAYYLYKCGATASRRAEGETRRDFVDRRKREKWSIPRTGNDNIDELITILTKFDQTQRFDAVYGQWSEFQGLAVFRDFKWPEVSKDK